MATFNCCRTGSACPLSGAWMKSMNSSPGRSFRRQIVKQDKALLLEDWKESIEPLILSGALKLNADSFSVEQYFSAKSLVSSRSFQIDTYHGFGMVPLADLFNHMTGGEHVHFTSVCSPSSSDDEGDGEGSDALEDDKSTILNSNSSLSGEDSGALEIIIVRDVDAGSEVFNTYGIMGNAALLHRYGFTEPDNQYDIVNVDVTLVNRWCSSLFSNRYSKARVSLWRRLNYSGCISQNSEYFEISFDGKPQLDLLVLLYIIFLKDDSFEKLGTVADTFNGYNELTNVINLINITRTKCNKIQCNETREGIIIALMTKKVCRALFSLADLRESLYGANTLKEDIERLKSCTISERKLYHSLVLRVCERKILAKLRSHVLQWISNKKRKVL